MADTTVLEAVAARRAGSSPVLGTIHVKLLLPDELKKLRYAERAAMLKSRVNENSR